MKQPIFKMLAILLGLLIFLVFLEGVVRMFNLSAPRLGQQDPVFGTAYIPDQTAVNQFGVRIDIGRHGFRGPTPTKEKPTGTYRVVLLGDSFLQAQALPYEQTFYALLNENFRQAGQPMEVINMGVEGYGTAQEYLVYHHLAREYRPDLVILFFYVGNDLQDNFPPQPHRPAFRLEGGNLVPVPFQVKGERRGPLRDFLRHNLRIYNYLPDLFRGAIAFLTERVSAEEKARRQAEHQAQFERQGDVGPTAEALKNDALGPAWQVTLKILERLNQEVRADGGRLALVPLPMLAQVYDRYWELLNQEYKAPDSSGWDRFQPQHILEAFARRQGIRYVPFSETLAAAARDTQIMYYLPADFHFNSQAHELLFKTLGPVIADERKHAGEATPNRMGK